MLLRTLMLFLPSICFSLKMTTPVIRGSTKPIEFFDPLGFSKRNDKFNVSYFREAELKHGRVAMVSCLVIPVSELQSHVPAIHNFDCLPDYAKLFVVGGIAAAELNLMLRGWKNPMTNSFQVKDDYQPGDFGFNCNYDFSQEKDALLLDKELNNGRLAMFGSLGMIAQELVSGSSIF